MRRKLCYVFAIWTLASVVTTSTSAFAAGGRRKARFIRRHEITQNIQRLRIHNNRINNALRFFEDRGGMQWENATGVRLPRYMALAEQPLQHKGIDMAELSPMVLPVSKRNQRASCGVPLLQNRGALPVEDDPTTIDASAGWQELTFIPVLNLPYEWHGTAIAQQFDANGNLLDEYVGNIILVMPDHNVYSWNVVYEADVINNTLQPPVPGSDMYTNIDPSLPLSSTVKNRPLRNGLPFAEYVLAKITWAGGWRSYFKCTGSWCGGAAAGCAIIHWWNAEIAWGPCAVAGCVTAAVGCSYGTLWN